MSKHKKHPEHKEESKEAKEKKKEEKHEVKKSKVTQHNQEEHSKKRLTNNFNFSSAETTWKVISLLLALALLISIPTQGFRVWNMGFHSHSSSGSSGLINANGQPTMYLIENSKCSYCNNDKFNQGVKQFFGDFKVVVVPYNSALGKKILSQVKDIKALPAILVLQSQMNSSAEWSKVRKNIFNPYKQYYYISGEELSRTPYYLDAAKRAEIEKQHSEEAKLKSGFENETQGKPRIDFFVMAYCPFGNQAEEAIAPVYYEALKNNATFIPHYIIYSNYAGGSPAYCVANGTLCSMHGIQEVHEDEREICVYKLYGIKSWFDFALAMDNESNPSNSDAKWKSVAQSLGLDVNKIENCVKVNGTKYLEEEKALAEAVGASGSPTVFVGGNLYTGARTPKGYLDAICAEYSGAKPAGCSVTNFSEAPTTPQNAHCG